MYVLIVCYYFCFHCCFVDDDTELHSHLYILAKEKLQKELLLQSREAITISSQENPLAKDIETGPDSVEDQRGRARSLTRAVASLNVNSAMWHLDDESNYEDDLEKELEIFDEEDGSRTASEVSIVSVSDAIGSRISLGGEQGGFEILSVKEDRLQRLLTRLRTHVRNSQGSGGKPFQILTDAGKWRLLCFGFLYLIQLLCIFTPQCLTICYCFLCLLYVNTNVSMSMLMSMSMSMSMSMQLN
jgi:hypothetical protein